MGLHSWAMCALIFPAAVSCLVRVCGHGTQERCPVMAAEAARHMRACCCSGSPWAAATSLQLRGRSNKLLQPAAGHSRAALAVELPLNRAGGTAGRKAGRRPQVMAALRSMVRATQHMDKAARPKGQAGNGHAVVVIDRAPPMLPHAGDILTLLESEREARRLR